jgi:hypothetical protein
LPSEIRFSFGTAPARAWDPLPVASGSSSGASDQGAADEAGRRLLLRDVGGHGIEGCLCDHSFPSAARQVRTNATGIILGGTGVPSGRDKAGVQRPLGLWRVGGPCVDGP